MWVCQPGTHTLKTPLGLCPSLLSLFCFFLVGYAFEALPLLAVCILLSTCNAKFKTGRMVHGTMAPLPSSPQSSFREVGKGRLTRTPPGVLGRPCPPIPLHRTLKEGHGGGWGGMCRMESWGSAGGAEAPYRVDPHHVYTRTRVVCVYE